MGLDLQLPVNNILLVKKIHFGFIGAEIDAGKIYVLKELVKKVRKTALTPHYTSYDTLSHGGFVLPQGSVPQKSLSGLKPRPLSVIPPSSSPFLHERGTFGDRDKGMFLVQYLLYCWCISTIQNGQGTSLAVRFSTHARILWPRKLS